MLLSFNILVFLNVFPAYYESVLFSPPFLARPDGRNTIAASSDVLLNIARGCMRL